MRDFRDAKAMAQTLRQSLTQKSVAISHSESLELFSRMLGTADWKKMRDPGLVTDIISPHVAVSLAEKQALLATLDPVAGVEAMMVA